MAALNLSSFHMCVGTPQEEQKGRILGAALYVELMLFSSAHHTCYCYTLPAEVLWSLVSGICAVQYGESVDVADWFSGFCAVHDSSDGSPEEEAQAAVVPKPKKRRGRPSKKVLQRVCPSAEIALCHLAHTLYRSTVYKISLTVD